MRKLKLQLLGPFAFIFLDSKVTPAFGMLKKPRERPRYGAK